MYMLLYVCLCGHVLAGIGRATAAAFLGAGWRVLTISRSPCDVPGVVHTEVDLLAPGM
jgi:3-oxoacyl-[acyl-carrier protein] reductase